jgi:hypothetical protein
LENSLPIRATEIADGDLEQPIRQAEPHCLIFTLRYEEASRQVPDANPLRKTYEALALLTSFIPNFDDPEQPYQPQWRSAERRSLMPDDLTEDDLAVLCRLLDKLSEPALKARILDVLWIRRRDFQAALNASDAYLLAAEKLFKTEAWVYGVESLRRSFQLARSLGRAGENAERNAEAALHRILGEQIQDIHANFANHLLELAVEFRLSDPARFAAIAVGHGETCSKAGEFEFSRQYHKLAAGLFDRAGDKQSARTQVLRVADLFEEEADDLLKGETARAMASVTFLRQAFEINRQFKAEEIKVEAVLRKLRHAQTISLDHFQEFRVETKIADLQQMAASEVSGMQFEQALQRLAFIPELIDPKAAIQEQQRQATQSPLLHLLTTEIVDEQGRTIDKIEGSGATDPKEEDVEKRAFYWAKNFRWPFRVQAVIEPARAKIVSENAPRLSQLRFLVSPNPFIPPNHIQIFLKGLHSGLLGDMMLAVHLLVPQLENSLRFVLNQHGIDTTNIDSEGLEQNKALGKLLEFPELKRLLGDQLIFELRGVFCEKAGFNFRNDLAHGRLSVGDCFSAAGVNAWWLILRTVYVFYLVVKGPPKNGSSTS